MNNEKKNALQILQETSRTFFIPITRLPPICQEAVASAYLCLRAIDEVEDHSKLKNYFRLLYFAPYSNICFVKSLGYSILISVISPASSVTGVKRGLIKPP